MVVISATGFDPSADGCRARIPRRRTRSHRLAQKPSIPVSGIPLEGSAVLYQELRCGDIDGADSAPLRASSPCGVIVLSGRAARAVRAPPGQARRIANGEGPSCGRPQASRCIVINWRRRERPRQPSAPPRGGGVLLPAAVGQGSASGELRRALDALALCGRGRLHDGGLGYFRATDPLLHAEAAGRFHDPPCRL